MKTICVILTGGKSSRMGQDKATLLVEGETFLERLIRSYSEVYPVFVSSACRGQRNIPGIAELPDLHPGQGPLAGLEAAFCRTDADMVFLTAVDIPYASPSLSRFLCESVGEADACVIRRRNGQPEPVFAVYKRSCLTPLQQALSKGRRSFRALYEEIQVRWIEEENLSDYDLDRILRNINTPDDYRSCGKGEKNEP